tara:strand:- start:939 stop:1325 length:387 start_codon:yes stop_codon:yes gene_type:complete
MQNNIIEKEILNNSNKLLISESIKNTISFEEDNTNSNFNLSLNIDDKKSLSVLSLVKKKNKIKVLIHANEVFLNSIILESYENISVALLDNTLLSFNKKDYLLNYKINCHDNNNYLLEIILRRKENGI